MRMRKIMSPEKRIHYVLQDGYTLCGHWTYPPGCISKSRRKWNDNPTEIGDPPITCSTCYRLLEGLRPA